jgi:cytochrome c peroxidase
MKSTPLLLALAVLLMAATLDLADLDNYTNQNLPVYIVKDNTPPNNPITDIGATLGRVMFYDKNLSSNNTIACASCHKQQFAFGDTARLSLGLNGGVTGRHSMRLVNSRFGIENKFFWDERATSLEDQTTQPIQDHVEMGFSGTSGQPDLDSLIRKLESIPYYHTLFTMAFGTPQITEQRMQRALAQFVRSIQSYDSKFDAGLAATNNLNAPFPNFTPQENGGKTIFLNPAPVGAGCQGCHQAPEFDIDPNSLNNGVLQTAANPAVLDLTNTRAPTLRDLINPDGNPNGPMMHNGNFLVLPAVVNHYNLVPQNPNNTNLDPRLAGPGGNLQLTAAEMNNLILFLRTLTGVSVYTDPRWSNPFDENGNLELLYCAFTPTINGSTEICDGNTATYSVSAGPAGTIYYWTVIGGTILNNPPYSNSVQVQWTAANPNASITVTQFEP